MITGKVSLQLALAVIGSLISTVCIGTSPEYSVFSQYALILLLA